MTIYNITPNFKCTEDTRWVCFTLIKNNMPQIDKQLHRINELLGKNTEVSTRNLKLWRKLILEKVTPALILTGIEDFSWEEPYVFGGWDADEYEELKKTNPSYTDEYYLITIKEPDEDADLIASLKRISDKKTFEIPLSWLVPTDSDCSAYELVDDYSVWRYNY